MSPTTDAQPERSTWRHIRGGYELFACIECDRLWPCDAERMRLEAERLRAEARRALAELRGRSDEIVFNANAAEDILGAALGEKS